MNKLLYIVLFSALSIIGYAQGNVVSGIVTDATDGSPLAGVTVRVEQSTAVTATDLDGRYSIRANTGDVLVFSFIGKVSLQREVKSDAPINVSLEDDKVSLDEVVVVGYGTMKKSDLTGAVAKVSTDDLKQLSTVDIGQALAGRVAGVDIISNSGEPGSGTKIRIRGYGTINTSDPLYVVDGFPVSDIDYLSPQDIASLEILKDASATAIYGSRGANGVILIQTRGGRFNTRTSVTANAYVSISNMAKTVDLLNAWEFATLKKEKATNSGQVLSAVTEAMFDYVIANKYEGTDWAKEVSRVGISQNYNLDVSGGTDRHTYGAGLTYSKTQGVLKYNERDMLTARLNNTYKLTSDVALGVNIIYTHNNTKGGGGGTDYYGAIWPAVLRADPLTAAWDSYTDIWGQIRNSDVSFHPARQSYNGANYGYSANDMFIANASLQWDNIAKVKGLSFRAQYGVRANFSESQNYAPVWYVSADQKSDNSSLSVSRNKFNSWLANAYLMYNREFGKHSLGLTLGTEAQEFNYVTVGASASNIPEAESLWYINNTTDISSKSSSHSRPFWNRMASFFFRGNYTYAGKYLLTATVRADGSSKFINHWGYFPSFSLGWNLHEEEFMQSENRFLQQLKVRAGWGQVGNEATAGSADYIALMEPGYNAVIGDQVRVGAIQKKFANEELRWEAAEQLNFGVDFAFWNYKLTGTIDYFIRTTRDMILATPIPLYAGMGRANINAGEMRNNGLEFSLRYAGKKGDFSYSIGANASFIKNKVLNLGSPDPVYGQSIGRIAQPFTITEVGMEMAYFYGFKTDGLFQTQQEVDAYVTPDGRPLLPGAHPGDVKFLKLTDDGEPINDKDRTYLGSGMADVTWGLSANLAYKGFDLAVFLQSSIGNDIANAAVMDMYSTSFEQWNMSKEMMNRWTGTGSTNKYPRLNNNDSNNNSRFSDRYIEDGTYVRIKNVQLGYTLPQALTQKIKIQQLRLYFSVDNLYCFTNYSGFDPEMGDYYRNPLNLGIDLASYPRPRTFVVGLNITL
jgi:TonB-linked SusC/RagA family outer membrane protein